MLDCSHCSGYCTIELCDITRLSSLLYKKKKNKHLNLKRPKQSVTTKNEYKKSLVPRLVYMSKTHVNMILMYTDCISIKPTPDSLDPCYGNVHKSVENTIHCIKLLAI